MAFVIKKYFDDADQMLLDIHEIDKIVFEGEMIGTIENEKKRFEKNSRSFIVLYDEHRAIGYITYYATTPDFAECVKRDNVIHDDDISPDEIVGFVKGRKHYIYILSIAILPEYQGGKAMKMLGNAFKNEVTDMKKEGYIFEEFLSTAISPDGERALSGFGLYHYKTIEKGYKVYYCTGDEFKAQ